MTVNLKRGLLEGAAVAAICAGLVAFILWRSGSKRLFSYSDFSNIGLVACSTGLLGFLAGAFRSAPEGPKK